MIAAGHRSLGVGDAVEVDLVGDHSFDGLLHLSQDGPPRVDYHGVAVAGSLLIAGPHLGSGHDVALVLSES